MNLEDLERFRDADGFIDFDRIAKEEGMEQFSPRREVRGTESREKIWLHLGDSTVLLKTVEENTNLVGTCYAEMITSELAKQAGFEVAKVDLIKYKGFCGVISEKVNREGEQLHSLREYIGDEEIENDSAPEITGLDFVFENLADYLRNHTDMSKADKYVLLRSVMKLMVFDVITIGTDRHTENISFIERMKDGKKEIVLAPLYDNEFSLMLETREADLREYLQDSRLFYGFVDAQAPKIAPKYEGMEKVPCHYQNLFEEVIGMDEDVEEYAIQLTKKLDVVQAIKNVEEHIGASIPSVFRDTAVYAFERRKKEIEQCLGLDLYMPGDGEEMDF
ncbi:MAG: HipA domain-containing protein [Clostridia bacterium]|nr:HipA domain-containing protein [Clostridia bacterium]